jgi:hypothetical protein
MKIPDTFDFWLGFGAGMITVILVIAFALLLA